MKQVNSKGKGVGLAALTLAEGWAKAGNLPVDPVFRLFPQSHSHMPSLQPLEKPHCCGGFIMEC
jgi:hypothetical protein